MNGIGSVVANGFLFVYGVPCVLRIVNGHIFKPSKDFNLGWASIPCAFIGAGYALWSVATIALPNSLPVTSTTVNVAPIFLASIIAYCIISFPIVAYFNLYRGPALRKESDEDSTRPAVNSYDTPTEEKAIPL